MNDFLDFSGKHVFVAGGSSGINLGIATAFAAHGASVAIASRSQEHIYAALAQIGAHGGPTGKYAAGAAAGYAADVRDPVAIAAALASAHARFGEIDVLVSGAAGNFVASALGMSPNAFRTVVDIDLNGSFNVLRGAYAYLRRPGASVINISAPQSIHPTMYQAHVCAAKAGVDMLTRVLAMEWGPDGVRVNSIIPGPIGDTEGMRRLAPTEAARAAVLAAVPLRRFGTPQDIADMALMLSSPLGGYVTGALIPVDGGASLFGGYDLSAALPAAPR